MGFKDTVLAGLMDIGMIYLAGRKREEARGGGGDGRKRGRGGRGQAEKEKPTLGAVVGAFTVKGLEKILSNRRPELFRLMAAMDREDLQKDGKARSPRTGNIRRRLHKAGNRENLMVKLVCLAMFDETGEGDASAKGKKPRMGFDAIGAAGAKKMTPENTIEYLNGLSDKEFKKALEIVHHDVLSQEARHIMKTASQTLDGLREKYLAPLEPKG